MNDGWREFTLWEKVSTVLLLLVIVVGTFSLACLTIVIGYLLSI